MGKSRFVLLILTLVFGEAFSQTEKMYSVPDSVTNQWNKNQHLSGNESICVDIIISGIGKINPEVKAWVISVSGISRNQLTSQLMFKLSDEGSEYQLPINDHEFRYEWDATSLYEMLQSGEISNAKMKLRKYRKKKDNKETEELWMIESVEVGR